MSRFNLLIGLGILALAVMSAQGAQAAQRWVGWWPGHWQWVEYKKFNGYLENSKHTQNQQWADEDWYVQDWLSQNQDKFKLIDGFFKSDIFREQAEDDGVPVLVVGPNFYRLGGFDKRRVVTTVDEVYGVTANGAYPVIVLKDWYTKRQIGVFNKEGLQIE